MSAASPKHRANYRWLRSRKRAQLSRDLVSFIITIPAARQRSGEPSTSNGIRDTSISAFQEYSWSELISISRHHSDRRYTCEFCGKDQFNRLDNLNTHHRLHAQPTRNRNRRVDFLVKAVSVIEEEDSKRKRRASSRGKATDNNKRR